VLYRHAILRTGRCDDNIGSVCRVATGAAQIPARRQRRVRNCQGGGKEAAPAQRGAGEALVRSRGGYGIKACVIANSAGRAVAFALAPGQA
jgi:hypothetical protein